MSELEIIRWVLYAIGGGFIWFLKRIIDQTDEKIRKLEAELIVVKSTYLHKDDFREFKTELREMFDEIKKDIRQLSGRSHDV